MIDESQKPSPDGWQDKYFAVIFELDNARLTERIKAAEEAMSKRSYELLEDVDHKAERLLLVKFSQTLAEIKRRHLLAHRGSSQRTA